MDGTESKTEVVAVEEENYEPPTVSDFLVKVEEYRKEIWCNGKRTASHTYPSAVEFVDKDRKEFRLVGDSPITHMGCGCWTGIKFVLERVEDDQLDLKALAREVAAMTDSLKRVNAWIDEHGKLPEWGRDKSKDEKLLASPLSGLRGAAELLAPLLTSDIHGLLRQTSSE